MKPPASFITALLLSAVLVLAVLATDGEDVFTYLPYLAKSPGTAMATAVPTNTPQTSPTPIPTEETPTPQTSPTATPTEETPTPQTSPTPTPTQETPTPQTSPTPTPTEETPTPQTSPTATPTEETPTPQTSPTPTPTEETPTATIDPQPSSIVTITEIFFDGDEPNNEGDEYVEIRNDHSAPIQLENWTLSDAGDIHVFIFPNYLMLPDEVCRIYTDEDHPEWCGFNYMNAHAIWNNVGDTATLQDSDGTVIDTCTYDGNGTTADCD